MPSQDSGLPLPAQTTQRRTAASHQWALQQALGASGGDKSQRNSNEMGSMHRFSNTSDKKELLLGGTGLGGLSSTQSASDHRAPAGKGLNSTPESSGMQ